MADLVLTCGYAALFLYLIGRMSFFRVEGFGRKAISLLFLLKVAAGTGLWWIYTFHYSDRANADIYKFFDDGNVMFSALPAHPLDYLQMLTGIGTRNAYFNEHYYEVMNNWFRRWETGYYNDAHTMIRYNALVRLFSFGVYHVHTVFSAFLSLVGLVALYKAFIRFVPGMGRVLVAGLFLWPSVLLWSSAPIKEALLFFGLGLFLLALFSLGQGRTGPKVWALLFTGLIVQLSLKSYVLACMLPGLAALWWCRRSGNRLALLKFGATHLAAVVLILVAPRLTASMDVVAMIHQKMVDMLGVVAATDPGSYVATPVLEPGVWGLLKALPHALYLTFLAPMATWDIGALGIMAAMENALMLALIPLALVWARPWQQINLPVLLYCLCFCIALGLLIGWTTPVVGALMRYRVPMLPFWSLAFLLIAGPERLQRTFNIAQT